MFLLRVTGNDGSVTQHIAEAFPYRIGRAAGADLQIEAPGVFTEHASILPAKNFRFLVQAEGESLLLRNGEPIRSTQLAPGDELTIGSARVLVSLAPASQKGLRAAEGTVWVLLLGVLLAQAAVFLAAN